MPLMTGWKFLLLMLAVGITTMFVPHAKPVGIAAWAIGLAVGLPWIVVDVVRSKRKHA